MHADAGQAAALQQPWHGSLVALRPIPCLCHGGTGGPKARRGLNCRASNAWGPAALHTTLGAGWLDFSTATVVSSDRYTAADDALANSAPRG